MKKYGLDARAKKYWVDAKVDIKEADSYNHTPSLAAKTAFFYVQSAGHFKCNRGYYTKREGYRSILMIYTVSGNGYARYRDREYSLKSGQVLIMDCFDYQEYYQDNNSSWEIKWLHFYGSSSQDYFNLIYEKHGAVIDLKDSEEYHHILDEILRMADGNGFMPEARASLLITCLLTELLLEGYDPNEGCDVKALNEIVRRALDFVEVNYSSNISLTDMANYSCCSRYHFSRLFKKVTGFSPYEYLVKYRMNKAKNLLRSTEKTVEEIAGIVGFGSNSNFIRTFRELEGMTPLKYRKYWN